MKELIVVADLGCLKAYRVIPDEINGSASVVLIRHEENPVAHTRQSDRTTDQAGRFPGGKSTEAGGMAQGENHNEKTETRRRILEGLADSVNDVVREEGCQRWFLAAPRGINQQLVDKLSQQHRDSLKKNLTLDLTKAGKKELLERFR